MSLLYLISSLPMLSLDTAPGLSPEAFAEACRAQLGAKDAATAEALLRGEAADHPFVLAWRDKDALLRNAAARERARRSGTDAARWLRETCGSDRQIDDAVEDAFQEADPLKREKELDQIRWRIAEELQGPDPLDLKAVFAYAVKLALLSRWRALDKNRGQNLFDTLTQLPVTLNPEP